MALDIIILHIVRNP